MRGPIVGVFLMLSPLLPAVPGVGAAEPQPVDEILARHVDALGGRQRLEELSTLTAEGIYAYNGVEHPLRLGLAGGRSREEIEGLDTWGSSRLDGRRVVRVWNGAAGRFLATPEPGTVESIGEMGDAVSFGRSPSPHFAWLRATDGATPELVGRETVDGREAFHLVVRTPGPVEHWYLDSDSHLPLRRTLELGEEEDGPKAPYAWSYDDWREVDGVKLPFFVQVEERLFAREYLFEAFEVNPEVPAGRFELP